MMNILITGGAGYIGSVLVPLLLEYNYNITVVDNYMYKQTSLLDVCHYKNLKIIKEDVLNHSILKKYVQSHDVIIPLAGIVGAPSCEKNKKMATDINQLQVKYIVETMSSKQRIILPVTNSGYGVGLKDQYCDETSPLNPISHYGITKVESEKYIMDRDNSISLRLATVFGASPRMRIDLLVNDFVHRAITEGYIILFESHFKRNYIHVRDVCYTIIHCLDNFDEMKNEIYNVGLSDANLSKLELCLKIKSHLNNLKIIESNIAEDPDKRNYIVSNKKLESTNWNAKYNIDHGIDELIKVFNILPGNNFTNII